MGSDSRIGHRFLNPGVGYGGSCFPKDVKAFRAVADDCGYDFRLLDEVMKINDEQRQRFVKKVRGALWILKGKRLAVLGLAFKGGTDDIRDSQAIAIVQALLKEGCAISAYDPAAMPKAQTAGVFPKEAVFFAENSYAAAKGADAVLVLTDWEEFASLDLDRLRAALKHPIMIDGRNLFQPEKMAELGFNYISVGRPDVVAKKSAAIPTPSGS
jgi:UDPglucose 6-dehydrogenase